MDQKQLMQFDQNFNVLANAAELAVSIVQELAGDDIANTMNGRVATTSDLANPVGAVIQSNFSIYLGGQ